MRLAAAPNSLKIVKSQLWWIVQGLLLEMYQTDPTGQSPLAGPTGEIISYSWSGNIWGSHERIWNLWPGVGKFKVTLAPWPTMGKVEWRWRDGGTNEPMEIWGHTVHILIWTTVTAYTDTHTTTSVWEYKRLGAAEQSKKRNEIISKQWRILCAEYKASNWHTKKKTYIISPSFSISQTPIVYVYIYIFFFLP